jgi:hypothetical protein
MMIVKKFGMKNMRNSRKRLLFTKAKYKNILKSLEDKEMKMSKQLKISPNFVKILNSGAWMK